MCALGFFAFSWIQPNGGLGHAIAFKGKSVVMGHTHTHTHTQTGRMRNDPFVCVCVVAALTGRSKQQVLEWYDLCRYSPSAVSSE